MSDTDRQPDAIDVFVHTIFELDEAHFDGNIIVSTGIEPEKTDDIRRWLLERPGDLNRCYVGEAIVARSARFAELDDFESYFSVAREYDVPYELIAVIGDGVVGKTFAEAAAFVRKAISDYRAGPEHFRERYADLS